MRKELLFPNQGEAPRSVPYLFPDLEVGSETEGGGGQVSQTSLIVEAIVAYLLLGVGFMGILTGIHGSGVTKADFKNPLVYLAFLTWVLIALTLIPKAIYRFFYRVGYFLGSRF